MPTGTFTNPPPDIEYNAGGTGFQITAGYTDIFTHNNQASCTLTTCRVMTLGCGSTFSGDVSVEATAPYKLIGVQNNAAGYYNEVCF